MKLRNKKTGKIVETRAIMFGDALTEDGLVWKSYTPKADSLAELNEKWEDYKPAEPLIKDEKVRKAVRAWAGFFYEESLRVVVNEDFISLFCDIEHYSASPEMDISPESFGGGVISDHYYTIAELCGEEEE